MLFDGSTTRKRQISLGGRKPADANQSSSEIIARAREERAQRQYARDLKTAAERCQSFARRSGEVKRAKDAARHAWVARYGDEGARGDICDWRYLAEFVFFADSARDWLACARVCEKLLEDYGGTAKALVARVAADGADDVSNARRTILRLSKLARVILGSMRSARGSREHAGGETSGRRSGALTSTSSRAVDVMSAAILALTSDDDGEINLGRFVAQKLCEEDSVMDLQEILMDFDDEEDAENSSLRGAMRILCERLSKCGNSRALGWMLATRPQVWKIFGDEGAYQSTRELWSFVLNEVATHSDLSGERNVDGLHAVDFALENILHPMKHYIESSTIHVGRAFVTAVTRLLTSEYLSAYLFAANAASLYDDDDEVTAMEVDDDDDEGLKSSMSRLWAIRREGRRGKAVPSSVDMKVISETPTYTHLRDFFSVNMCISRLVDNILPANDVGACIESSPIFCKFLAACDTVLKGIERDTLLRTLAFGTGCLSRLWAGLVRGHNVADRSYRRNICVFAKIYHLYTMLSDDEEFYRLRNPLSMQETGHLVAMLRDVLWELLWTKRGPDGTCYEKLDAADEYADAETWYACATTLAHLHDRNGRQQFTDPMEFHVLRDNIDIMSLLQEAKESKSRASTLLSAAPCLVPFEVRVHTFMDARKRDRRASGVGYAGIRVRRGNLLEDGMNALSAKLTESLEGIIRVQFVNEQGLDEAGVDGGGLFKDFLNDLITESFDPKFGLFVETPERMLYPNPASEIHAGEKHLQYFYFLGAIIGKAAYEGILLDVPLAGFFLAALKGGHVEFNDLTTLDPELYRNLVSLKRYPGDVRDLCLYFTAIDRSGMDEQEIELILHGSSIEVTNANVPRYIHCMSQFLLRAQIHRQIACFVSGFEIMMRKRWLNMFTPAELRLLISGNRTGSMDIADMAANCEYSGGYAADHPVIRTFWNVMREIAPDEQRQVLKFITSCSNTPLLGFSHLEPRLVIHRSGTAGTDAPDSTADLTRLPTAATCMNLLKLPPYTSKDMLKSKLLYAVQSNSGFDLS